MEPWDTIADAISEAGDRPFVLEHKSSVGGGCINRTYRLSSKTDSFFVKLNHAKLLPMFEAEAGALEAIIATRTVRAPTPLAKGLAGDAAFLVLEYIPMGSAHSDTALGRQLARMHRSTTERFGWEIDNTIGSTPQPNTCCDDWIEFWRTHRLGFQLQLAAQKGAGSKLLESGQQLLNRLPAFFDDYRPVPSLLHGDLWGGNRGTDQHGQPVVYDPASYYGDRETDVAMTELFGGFSREFYAAYNKEWPLDSGYAVRRTLYNLYHILNHFNLFGGGYLSQAQSMIDQLLSSAR